MGTQKTTDGRYLVGIGYEDVNDYKGGIGTKDMVIQYTADGVTEQSMAYLEFLKDYAEHHAAIGELIKPADVSIWIAKDDKLTAVEADDISYDDGTFTLSSITYDGTDWTFGEPTPGGGGGSFPAYTVSDIGKGLSVINGEPIEASVSYTFTIPTEAGSFFANASEDERWTLSGSVISDEGSGFNSLTYAMPDGSDETDVPFPVGNYKVTLSTSGASFYEETCQFSLSHGIFQCSFSEAFMEGSASPVSVRIVTTSTPTASIGWANAVLTVPCTVSDGVYTATKTAGELMAATIVIFTWEINGAQFEAPCTTKFAVQGSGYAFVFFNGPDEVKTLSAQTADDYPASNN